MRSSVYRPSAYTSAAEILTGTLSPLPFFSLAAESDYREFIGAKGS